MSEQTDKRVTELEIQLAHVQRMFDQLNEVVTDQSNQIDLLQRTTKKLTDKLSGIKDQSDESRDPSDEKPPHY